MLPCIVVWFGMFARSGTGSCGGIGFGTAPSPVTFPQALQALSSSGRIMDLQDRSNGGEIR